MNEACHAKLLALDVGATECYAYAASKLLGIAIIVASFALKVPQIVKILGNRSVAGLSFEMFSLELFAFVFQGTYAARNGFPLDSYLEIWVILAQNFIIIALMYVYSSRGFTLNGAALLGSALLLIAAELTVAPMSVVVLLQTVSVALFAIAKLPQIVKGFAEKSTGQLDLFMVSMQTLGSLVRVFTTLQSVNDPIYLFSFILGSTLNAIITLQVLVYGGGGDAGKGGASATQKKQAKKID